jgi:hypothetical protein
MVVLSTRYNLLHGHSSGWKVWGWVTDLVDIFGWKDQELWWVEGRDLVNLVAPNMVFFLHSSSSLRWKKGRGIYSPSQNVVVAVVEGRIIRLAGLSGPLTGLSAPPHLINPPPGWNIRPLYWVTPALVLSRFWALAGREGDYPAPWPEYPAPILGDGEPGT